jgi:hypothetical protein
MKYIKLFEPDEWLFQKVDGNEFARMAETHDALDFTGDEYNKLVNLLKPKGLIYHEEDGNTLYFRLNINEHIDNIKIAKLDDEWYIIFMWNKAPYQFNGANRNQLTHWHFYKCDTFKGVEEWINEMF